MSAYQQEREARWAESQRKHDERMAEMYERDRPKPPMELGALLALARRAVADPSLLIEWSNATGPQAVLDAHAAAEWDRTHPFYACIHCHDGKDLPRGYMCEVCGEGTP